jgi:hypothetical protein
MNTFYKAFQFGGPINHMLVQGCSILGPAIWRIEDPGFELRDVVFRSTELSVDSIWPGQLLGLTYEE